MKKFLPFVVAIFLVGGIYYLAAIVKNGAINNPNTSQKLLESRTNADGAVTVTVTPLNFFDRALTWDFEIVMDTHSVELSEDLTKISVLVDDQGVEHSPINWEGDLPGGHHRSGILKFQPMSSFPKSLELKIRGLGSISERSFLWAELEITTV